MVCAGRRFRGRNPPASLKQGDVRRDKDAWSAVFPGEKSSGLIEALNGTLRISTCTTVFPGEKSSGLIEAAAHTGGSQLERKFPGEKSSGLIEAKQGQDQGSERPMSFRGRNPPASLKRALELHRLAPLLARFPGEKSSGLIEAR